jgi:pyrophosphate--fructose-6-phosphate 1-phosphotransferase
MTPQSPLEKERLEYKPVIPEIFNDPMHVVFKSTEMKKEVLPEIRDAFPHIYDSPLISFEKGTSSRQHQVLRVGVVFSGGQASGGHNVIVGLYDTLKKLDKHNELIGFLNGPKGIIDNKSIKLDESLLNFYINQGGFDLLGSGRDKIETQEQFLKAKDTVISQKINGLVIIGGDDSNTIAAFLSEFFYAHGLNCSVIGIPKTIDGDLKNEYIATSFGFDTATKIYSEFIGNTARDAKSAKKYTFFIKLMGRSASHVTLECALQTHPNFTLIGEEIAKQEKTLDQITHELADMVQKRSEKGKEFGVVLIPEGVLEFIPEFKKLISELNKALAPHHEHAKKIENMPTKEKVEYLSKHLSEESMKCLKSIPEDIQAQLFLDRDPHGNLQVSKIESEKLFIETVKAELKRRGFKGKFNPVPLFCGYEGRCGLPSNFDSNYCYSLGATAALLIQNGCTGYVACVKNLHLPARKWQAMGVPLATLMYIETRKGIPQPVIQKALVDLDAAPFMTFHNKRQIWWQHDDYRYPGPIQFFGPEELTDGITYTLALESQ